MKNISIFASGSGTNAENIIKYFSNTKTANVNLVLSNKPEAMVLKRAEALNTETLVFDYNDFYKSGKVLERLVNSKTDFIVLSGFLWLVPVDIIDHYAGRIVNIHPALLPAYGGKGMYGDAVHKAVISRGDTVSGITIHYVDNHYDQGNIIFQAKCKIEPGDTPEILASKVHHLEYKHFPRVIEELVMNLPF
jgi:phosphoribosylglycinamide formyltransferase-1